MTRKEKIQIEIDECKYRADCPFDYETGFKRGVEWADKHPNKGLVSIDDVCKWLNSHTDKHPDSEYLNMFFSMLSDNFRKDMEGQL